MDMNLRRNIAEVQRGLSDAARNQVPYATAQAINATLVEIKRNTDKRLKTRLKRPTPFTMRAFRIKRATKRRLSGSVFAMDMQAAYLIWAEKGGERYARRKAVLVPVGARLNKYGNMARGAVKRLLARPKVFSGAPHGRKAGIYQRMGTKRKPKLKLLVHYTPSASYKRRLGFKDGAVKTAAARMAGNFERALRNAFKSRR